MGKKPERITTVLLLAYILWGVPRRFMPDLKWLEYAGGAMAAVALYMCLTHIFKGARDRKSVV